MDSKDIFDTINTLLSFVSDILPLVTFISGLVITKAYKKYRSYLLNRVLSLKKAPVEVVVPARVGCVTHSVEKTSPNEAYITYVESTVLIELYKMADILFNTRSDENVPFLYSMDNNLQNETNNAFFIGGILANSYVQDLFLNQYSFRKVCFSCSQESYNSYTRMRPILIVDPELNQNKRRIYVDGSELFSYSRDSEGYIILIKLTGKTDFRNRDHGTHHICFGNNSSTTLQSVQCYDRFRKEINKRLRKRKNHYFVIVKCRRGGQLDFNEFHDITDTVF